MGFFDPIDWNGDGKHDIFDDMLEFEIFQRVMKDDSDSDDEADDDFDDDFDDDYEYDSDESDVSWREFCEDGSKYGVDPEDYDDEDDYLEALKEAKYEWRDYCDDEGLDYE